MSPTIGPFANALAGTLAGAALRPLSAGVALGLRTERELRTAALRQASTTALRGLDAILASAFAEEVVERVLASPLARRAVGTALSGPLIDEAVERLLHSDELWRIVDEVARSPSVADAITRQSVGFVDEIADGVRAQSRSADTWLESRVRNAFRRAPRPQPGDA